LVGLGGVDVHDYNDFAFRRACEYGRLEVARWLLSLEPTARVVSSCVNRRLRSWSRARSAWCVG
jgi:hypothetical protein